jgi:Tol biopolymer transport system component
MRVLAELREGRTNAEIAIRLGLSINTVKYHVANMLSKLSVADRAELARWQPEARVRARRHLSGKGIAWVAGLAGALAAAGAAVIIPVALLGADAGSAPDVAPTNTPPLAESRATILFVSVADTATGEGELIMMHLNPGKGGHSPPYPIAGGAGQAVFSPVLTLNGAKLAFYTAAISDLPVRPDAASVATLHVREALTMETTDVATRASLTPSLGAVEYPAWRPDGGLLAFFNQDFLISTVQPDGTGGADQILGCATPGWSRDGHLRACAYFTPVGEMGISWAGTGPDFRDDTAGPGAEPARKSDRAGNDTNPQFSQDGRWLAWQRCEVDGVTCRVVLQDPDGEQIEIGAGREPRWSPDGTRILFSDGLPAWFSRLLGFDTSEGPAGDIYVYDVPTARLTNLTNSDAAEYWPDWSSDGSEIAFISNRDRHEGEIYIMDADGSHVDRVTYNHEAESQIAWSPR